MIRMMLVAAATLATITIGSPVAAQTGAPVRTPVPSDATAGSTILIAGRKAPPCSDKPCTGKPLKQGYVGAAPLGW